ncbi:hypothetical protein EJ06DRAFT_13818 [Trichodelitschia bisporula]|uniref:Uncharacterized protein n=1 Tax=Trichodelitschia bisporula TaxID=703511 RepID=A0A6G1IAB8_9PEZI|nr:hypothetical protein EJ06DRAFT_13818 [Trichodelitschia bisporula]
MYHICTRWIVNQGRSTRWKTLQAAPSIANGVTKSKPSSASSYIAPTPHRSTQRNLQPQPPPSHTRLTSAPACLTPSPPPLCAQQRTAPPALHQCRAAQCSPSQSLHCRGRRKRRRRRIDPAHRSQHCERASPRRARVLNGPGAPNGPPTNCAANAGCQPHDLRAGRGCVHVTS